MVDKILVYEWQGRVNFGDLISKRLVERISGAEVVVADAQHAELIAVGSVLGNFKAKFPAAKAVWGSGFIQSGSKVTLEGINVLAVRGQQTANRLEFTGTLGDPGLLVSKYFETAEKTNKIGIIPHYKDKNDSRLNIFRESDFFKIIDVERSPEEVIKDISSVSMVLSSSLHGLIVADSFSIPNYWMRLSTLVNDENDASWKFDDYFSAIGRRKEEVILKDNLDELSLSDFERLKQSWKPVRELISIQDNLEVALKSGLNSLTTKVDNRTDFYTDSEQLRVPSHFPHNINVFTGNTRLLSDRKSGVREYIHDLYSKGYKMTKITPSITQFRESKSTTRSNKSAILFSIIIATYNAENYIWRALEAILAQDIDLNEVQVIISDDGSSDETLKIASEYKNVLPNLLIIESDENSGNPVVPRNKGISSALGEYIFIHDADDYLTPNALSSFKKFVNTENPDVVVPRLVGEGGRKPPKSQFQNGTVSNAEFLKHALTWNLNPQKLFRRSLIVQNDIVFKAEAPVFEDHVFVVHALLHSKKVSVLDGDGFYVLTRHEGSHLSNDNWQKDPSDIYRAVDIILGMIKQHYFLSNVQQIRWSTSILRRHLKQLEAKIPTLDKQKAIDLTEELGGIVKKYASIGWLAYFPRVYHNLFKYLVSTNASETVDAVIKGYEVERLVPSEMTTMDTYLPTLRYFDEHENILTVMKNTWEDSYAFEKHEAILIKKIHWSKKGVPLVVTEQGNFPYLYSQISKPSAKLLEITPFIKQLMTVPFTLSYNTSEVITAEKVYFDEKLEKISIKYRGDILWVEKHQIKFVDSSSDKGKLFGIFNKKN